VVQGDSITGLANNRFEKQRGVGYNRALLRQGAPPSRPGDLFSGMRIWPYSLVGILLLALSAPSLALHSATAPTPGHKRSSVRRHGRRLRWNPMFRPSHESLLKQNEEIDRLELPRIQDDDELEALKASAALVPLREGQTLKVDRRLDPARRYCRPWTRDFVEDLSHAYYNRFHAQIQVNSAVRTVKVQKKLRRHNRNAAPAEGDTASSHLAGVTLDIQRRGMSREQVQFVHRYLFYLRALDLIEPEEERRQWVFHVMVSDRYGEWRGNQTIIPVDRPLEVEAAQVETK
jgi:uncharacterized protein DUF5715